MPKRTNLFQKVMHLAQVHLAADAVVTESKLLTDLVTTTKREVDICIETTIADHGVVVCIECRDHKRPADVSWVDAIKSDDDRGREAPLRTALSRDTVQRLVRRRPRMRSSAGPSMSRVGRSRRPTPVGRDHRDGSHRASSTLKNRLPATSIPHASRRGRAWVR